VLKVYLNGDFIGHSKGALNQAIELLRNTTDAIGDIAIKVVFSSYVQFAKAFQKARQMSPSAFRKAISNGELSPRKID
jgi:AraC-like DNA-binding protein